MRPEEIAASTSHHGPNSRYSAQRVLLYAVKLSASSALINNTGVQLLKSLRVPGHRFPSTGPLAVFWANIPTIFFVVSC